MNERPLNEEEDRLLKPGEVGRLMSVSSRTVSLWGAKGKIPFVTTPGGHRLFRESDVRRLLQTVEED